MAKLGVQAIEMYCHLVKEQFGPILSELNSREVLLKNEIEVAVKKELGIYDLYVKQAKLELELSEIKRELKGWEDKTHTPMGFITPIEERVQVILKKSRNGLIKEVQDEMNRLVYKIKLSGLDDDTKSVFDVLPGIIEKLAKKVEKLPPLNTKKLLK